jgi:hypothetical protein
LFDQAHHHSSPDISRWVRTYLLKTGLLENVSLGDMVDLLKQMKGTTEK